MGPRPFFFSLSSCGNPPFPPPILGTRAPSMGARVNVTVLDKSGKPLDQRISNRALRNETRGTKGEERERRHVQQRAKRSSSGEEGGHACGRNAPRTACCILSFVPFSLGFGAGNDVLRAASGKKGRR